MRLGDSLGRAADRQAAAEEAERDQREAFEVERELIQLRAEQERRLDESRRNITGTGAGFTEETGRTWDAAANQTFDAVKSRGLSPRGLQRLDIGLLRQRSALQEQASRYERQARDAYHLDQTTQTLRTLTDRAVQNPATLPQSIQEGLALIDNSGLSPSAKRTERERFRVEIQRAEITQRLAQARTLEEREAILNDLRTIRRQPGATEAPTGMSPGMSLDDEMAADAGVPATPVEIAPVPGNRTPINARPRPEGARVEGVVIHHTAGTTLEGAIAANSRGFQRGTGAHIYIDTDGKAYRFAGDELRMVHVRQPGTRQRTPGAWDNLTNENTIGIEVVAPNDAAVNDAQKETLQRVLGQLAETHGFDRRNVVGHGEIQGGPSGNREASEGAEAARAFREGRASRRSAGTPVDDEGEGFIFSDNPRYELSASERMTLLRNARTELRASVLRPLRDGLEALSNGRAPEIDSQGRTALDHARRFMTKLQFDAWQQRWQRAQDLAKATSDIYSQPLDQVDSYVARLPSSIREAVRRRAERLQQAAERDPARYVEGGDLRGSGRSPPVSIDPSTGLPGEISLTGEEDLVMPAHPAVVAAYDLARRVQPTMTRTVDEEGNEVLAPAPDAAEKVAQEQRRIIIDGRLAAQRARGVPEHRLSPVTKDEAERLLEMPRNTSSMTQEQFDRALRAASDRAYQQYGPYARMALDAAIKLRSNLSSRQNEDAQFVLRRMIDGVPISRDDVQRFSRLMELDREEEAWLGRGIAGTGGNRWQSFEPSPEMAGTPAGGTQYFMPEQPQAPAPKSGWFGSSQPAAPAWAPPPPATAADRLVSGMAANMTGTPTPAEINLLMRNPGAIQQRFDAKYGPGSAARYLQGQPQ